MGMIIQNGKQYFPVYNDSEIKALPTVDTASGSVATFDTDMTENLVEVKCQIVAKQSGSGTPSPSNPRPITVYNALNLERTNNDNFICGFISNANVDEIGKIVSNTSFNMAYALVIKGETYIITAELSGAIVCGYYGDIPQVGSMALDNTRHIYNSNVFTADATGFICFRMANTFTTPQLEKGNMATAYKDYTNNIGIHIPFGQTVANGVLNVGSGVLTVTHGYKDLGTLTWLQDSAYGSYFYTAGFSDKASGLTNMICTEYDNATGYGNQQPDLTIRGAESGNYHRLFVRNNAIANATAFNTAIQGVMLCYELETPTTIQLSSTQIIALLNENNIWCDTGDTEVKYLLTVGKKIA